MDGRSSCINTKVVRAALLVSMNSLSHPEVGRRRNQCVRVCERAGGFTWPMAASGWTTAAGWMKVADASLADPSEAPAGRMGMRSNQT